MMTLDNFYVGFSESDKDWVNSYRLDWMSDDQWLLYLFLNRFFKGFHHIPREPKPFGRGIEINFKPHCMANFDYDDLTKLVIMSHNWGVRVEIKGSGFGMIKLCLWKRHSREGDMYERIPTIDQMVEKYKDF